MKNKYIKLKKYKLWENSEKNYVKFGVGKMKIKKKRFCPFFKCSLNPNITKLVYLNLLSSNYRAWALKMSEYLKKFYHKNRAKKTLIRQLKGP